MFAFEWSFVWEETWVPGGNSPIWLGDHMTIPHANAGYRARFAAVSASVLTLRQPDSHNSNEFTSVQSMFSYNKYLQGLLYILFQGRVLYSNINCTWLFKPSCMITGFLWKEVMLQYWYRQTRSCGIPTNIKF